MKFKSTIEIRKGKQTLKAKIRENYLALVKSGVIQPNVISKLTQKSGVSFNLS